MNGSQYRNGSQLFCKEWMLRVFPFQRDVHVQIGDGRFSYLVNKFNSEMEVLYKVNEIKKLVIIHRSGADYIINVSLIELGHRFVVLL